MEEEWHNVEVKHGRFTVVSPSLCHHLPAILECCFSRHFALSVSFHVPFAFTCMVQPNIQINDVCIQHLELFFDGKKVAEDDNIIGYKHFISYYIEDKYDIDVFVSNKVVLPLLLFCTDILSAQQTLKSYFLLLLALLFYMVDALLLFLTVAKPPHIANMSTVDS